MARTQEKRGAPTNRVVIFGIAAAALAGWGAYAYSALSSTRLEQQLRAQTAALHDYQAQFLSQRKKADDAVWKIATLHEELASAQSEIQRLTMSHKETEANLATAREQLASFQKLHAPPALGNLEADGAMGPTTRQAIEEFQRVVGLTVTGELHGLTLQSLMRSAKVVAAQNERAE